MSESGIVNIRGKEYRTVAHRIAEFREKHPDYSMTSRAKYAGDLIQVKTTIRDAAGRKIATGHAEEERGSTQINRTSALENCETSSWGRCLANFGLGGSEIASADELTQAINQQAVKEEQGQFKTHMDAVKSHWGTIEAVKHGIATGELSVAVEALEELSDDDKQALWRAPTKGSIWTTQERTVMKSDEWAQVRRDMYQGDSAA